MKPNKEEYEKIQAGIVQFLFDKAEAVSFGEVCEFTKKPESETQYHCDVLRKQRLITSKSVKAGDIFIAGYAITSEGRAVVMEG